MTTIYPATYYVTTEPLRADHRLHLGECFHFSDAPHQPAIRPATSAEQVGRKVCSTCLARAARGWTP